MNFVVNLAPACFKKQGSNFDAAIAVAILCATGQSTHASAPFPLIGELVAPTGRCVRYEGFFDGAGAVPRRVQGRGRAVETASRRRRSES